MLFHFNDDNLNSNSKVIDFQTSVCVLYISFRKFWLIDAVLQDRSRVSAIPNEHVVNISVITVFSNLHFICDICTF